MARPSERKGTNSRIARLILASNLAGLIILIIAALVLNEMRAGLVQARIASLNTQGELIASVMADVATLGRPEPALDDGRARNFMRRLDLPPSVRIRLYDREKSLVGDTWLLSDRVDVTALPPLRDPSVMERINAFTSDRLSDIAQALQPPPSGAAQQVKTFAEEVDAALTGEVAAGRRFSDRGQRVVSVSVPVQRVSAVVGVLTLEASDVAEIVRAERAALLPFIGFAVLVALMSSSLLTIMIARPLRKLSIAADSVRAGTAEEIRLPLLTSRRDEIGDLANSVETMTKALVERIVANERFAADVAHELKNPLTSIRSAVETADKVDDPKTREKLRKLIASDVKRLDRLITDISNASRLEAEFARLPNERLDLMQMLKDLRDSYVTVRQDGEPEVILTSDEGLISMDVKGRDGPLGQVFRNLVDNARSFSPENGKVAIHAERKSSGSDIFFVVTVTDEGPGVPDDKLDKIFERFYTDRPAGAKFGLNSGLGLSIVKQIVESHSGSVTAQNRVNTSGAVFTVQLPAAT